MDPLSVAGIVQSSLSLALQLATAAKSLSDVVDKYRHAKLTIKALVQNLDILQLTWTKIGQWFEKYAEDESSCDDDLIKRVTGFLETGNLVMEALRQDLMAYDMENLNFMHRSKLVWNENTLERHQIRIRDQRESMKFFLDAIKLRSPQARARMLQDSERQFQQSNESAYSTDSIVLSQQRRSHENSSRGSLEYRPLSFENILFMSKVYIRNSKNMMIEKIHELRDRSKVRPRTQPVSNLEAIENELDAESLLLPCEVVHIESEEIGYVFKPNNAPTPFFEQLLLGIANYITRHIAPWDVYTLTPSKLAAFYRLVGGNYDVLFLDSPQTSLSFVYRTLGCYHTLQPSEDPHASPTLPALTPAGFVKWQIIQLLIEPETHGPFLQRAVKRFNLRNPIDGTSFPSILPKECLPSQPDMKTVEWHKNISEKLMMEDQASMAESPSAAIKDP